MFVTPSEIKTSTMLTPWNFESGMLTTLSDSSMTIPGTSGVNAHGKSSTPAWGSLMRANAPQSQNAASPIVSTLSGIAISSSDVQP